MIDGKNVDPVRYVLQRSQLVQLPPRDAFGGRTPAPGPSTRGGLFGAYGHPQHIRRIGLRAQCEGNGHPSGPWHRIPAGATRVVYRHRAEQRRFSTVERIADAAYAGWCADTGTRTGDDGYLHRVSLRHGAKGPASQRTCGHQARRSYTLAILILDRTTAGPCGMDARDLPPQAGPQLPSLAAHHCEEHGGEHVACGRVGTAR